MTRRRNLNAGLRENVREVINRTFPNGVVEMVFDSDESYFWEVYPKLVAAFRRIKGAWLVHEREPDGGPVWLDDSDPEEDLPYDHERSRSYHLFFVCPEGEAFVYETEIESLGELAEEDEQEESPMEMVGGDGRTGWSVTVSLLAPFAVIALSDMETFKDGSSSELSIESHGLTEAGKRIDSEAEFRKLKGERAFARLLKLRGRIRDILTRYGIGVLPEEVWREPVPGLRAEEAVLVGIIGDSLRVLDALFFEEI